VGTYVTAVAFISLFGITWINGKMKNDPDEERRITDIAYILAIIGLIIVSGLLCVNYVMYEFEFKKKCELSENFIKKNLAELSVKLDPKRMATDASRVVAETFSQSFKTQLKDAIVSQIKQEFPDMGSVSDLLNLLSGGKGAGSMAAR
jgi:predicted histidine transporter YuiF (NhaC family)